MEAALAEDEGASAGWRHGPASCPPPPPPLRWWRSSATSSGGSSRLHKRLARRAAACWVTGPRGRSGRASASSRRLQPRDEARVVVAEVDRSEARPAKSRYCRSCAVPEPHVVGAREDPAVPEHAQQLHERGVHVPRVLVHGRLRRGERRRARHGSMPLGAGASPDARAAQLTARNTAAATDGQEDDVEDVRGNQRLPARPDREGEVHVLRRRRHRARQAVRRRPGR